MLTLSQMQLLEIPGFMTGVEDGACTELTQGLVITGIKGGMSFPATTSKPLLPWEERPYIKPLNRLGSNKL